MENGAQEIQLVVFQLAGETYGVEITSVQEIIRMQEITKVPRTPPFVEGVINLRGRIIPVIDLRKRFRLPLGEKTATSRIIVVEVGQVTVGMIVDAVSEVFRLPTGALEPPPPVTRSVDTAFLKAVGKWGEKLIILLDLERVLKAEEYTALEAEFASGERAER